MENGPMLPKELQIDELIGVSRAAFSRDDVIAAYDLLLGRYPESETAIAHHGGKKNLRELLEGFVATSEFVGTRPVNHPSESFTAVPDARAIIASHAAPQRQPLPGSIVNFLGVATNATYLKSLSGSKTQVEGLPIPANSQAEMVEWAAVLRAIDLARSAFTMIEVGARWGRWMVNTAVAAKRRDLSVKVIGVEGDGDHIRCLKEHCAVNGLVEREFSVIAGFAGPRHGVALVPNSSSPHPGSDKKVRYFPSRSEADNFAAFESAHGRLYDVGPVVSLSGLAAETPRIDLLFVDIEGDETDLIAGSLLTLKEQVAYLVIKTHSRSIDGDMVRILTELGWALEFEKPTTIAIQEDGKPYAILDGTQGWRNPDLTQPD